MTEPSPPKIVSIHGKDVEVKQLTDMQFLYLNRYSQILQSDTVAATEKMEAGARLLDILESVIVKPESKKYLETLIVTGQFDMLQMRAVVTAFADEETVEAPKPKVRRGRPPAKSVK